MNPLLQFLSGVGDKAKKVQKAALDTPILRLLAMANPGLIPLSQLSPIQPTVRQGVETALDFTTRPVARLGAEGTMTATGRNKPIKPKGALEELLFGKEELRSHTDPNRPSRQFARSIGAPEELAIPLMAVGAGLDAVPFSPGKALKGVKIAGEVGDVSKAIKTFDLKIGKQILRNVPKEEASRRLLEARAKNIPATFEPVTQEMKNAKYVEELKQAKSPEFIKDALGKFAGRVKSSLKDESGGINFGADIDLPKLGSSLTEELAPITAKKAAKILQKPEEVFVKADKALDKAYGRTLLQRTTRAFPYADESAKVASTGEAGKEIVARGRRVNAGTLVEKNNAFKEIDDIGLLKLSPEEVKNLTLAREGREQFMNSRVMEVSNKIDESFIGKAPDELGFQSIDQYAPRRPNQAGVEYLKKNEADMEEKLVQKIMQEQGIKDKSEAVKMIRGGQRKAFFERQRVLDELPDEYRDFSVKPWLDYASEYARRKAVVKEFGIGDDIINKLKNQVGTDHLEMVDKYIGRIKGTTVESKDLKGLSDFIKSSMVMSKLTPLTTMANELQAHSSSFLTDGVTGIVRAMKPGGKKLVDELGLDNLRGKFGDFVDADSIATKWMKLIGMEGSEMRGIQRAAKSSWDGIDAAFKRLVKNPADEKAKKYLNELSMYVDEDKLARDLKNGAMDAEEKALGVIEASRQKMFFPQPGERPAWSNAPIGSSAYIFHNYVLHQLNLLRKAPVSRQIAYMAVIAPAIGLPMAYLRNVVTGKEQPNTPAEMFQQGSRYGPASPLELDYALGTERGLLGTIAGGFSPYAAIGREALSGNPQGVAKEAFKAAPIPFSNLIAPHLFPSKTQQKESERNARPVPGGGTRRSSSGPKTYPKPKRRAQ